LTILKTILLENNLENGLSLLTQREQEVISLYYIEGYKDEEIAKIYGICQQSVNESRKKGIKKLKCF